MIEDANKRASEAERLAQEAAKRRADL